MKKALFTLLLLSVFFSIHAQNYQCLQSGVKHYFINGNGYLRGIRIDSVKTFADSVVYYPYHTPRGPYNGHTTSARLDSTGGSWLGKKVLQLTDGTFIFDSYWGDSVVIKTQAIVGDNWIFYNDSGNVYYKATVISKDTMTVLSTLDSVKSIMVNAFNDSGMVTSDPVDSFKIILSKNHGFVQVFDLYTFPYHKPDSAYRSNLDFYLDKASTKAREAYGEVGYAPNVAHSIFNLVSLINPTYQQLYNFSVGDAYEYKECLLTDGFACDFVYMGIAGENSFYEMDSITEKITSGINTKYHFDGSASQPNPFYRHYAVDSGVASITLGDKLLLDTLLMPEEYKSDNVYYFLPNDTSYCVQSPYYEIVPSYLHGVMPPFYFEGPVYDTAYKLGIGQVNCYYKGTSASYFQVKSSELVYYKNSSFSCGTFHKLPNSVKSIAAADHKIQLYPNPAANELTIKTGQPCTITLLNVMGQAVQTIHTNKQETTIDVSHIPAGVYNVSITDESGNRYNDKVVILH